MSGSGCAVRRGFFVLRPCDRPPVAACVYCNRPVCAEHVVAGEAGPRCIECESRFAQSAGTPFWRARAATYAYRDRYYGSHTPHYMHNDYTTHDYNAFAQGPTDDPQDTDAGGGGFFDS